METFKLSAVYIVLLLSLIACAAKAFTPPPAWTLRADGKLRASQRKEEFTIPEFISKIKKEESNEYAICITPDGESKISAEMRQLRAQITKLKNDLDDCRSN